MLYYNYNLPHSHTICLLFSSEVSWNHRLSIARSSEQIIDDQSSINLYIVYVSFAYLHHYRAFYCFKREGEVRLAEQTDLAPERGEWICVSVDTGSVRVKTTGELKRHKWCVES